MREIVDCKNTISRNGRYKIKLDIPVTSTLTEAEIDRVSAICSWDADPNKEAQDYEGGRSILIRRQNPVIKDRVELRALQIAGIGYRKLVSAYGVDAFQGDIQPPNSRNFMDILTGTKMSTGYSHGKFVITRPTYRAMGTYTREELEPTVRNTFEIGNLPFERFCVPHVEAYGWYLEDDLKDKDGNFGFVVVPVPDIGKERIATEIRRRFLDVFDKDLSLEEAVKIYTQIAVPKIFPFVSALRELHERGRRAHLQTHLSNVYDVNGFPYIMDWTTARQLAENREDNIVNRVIDFKRPAEDFATIFSDCGQGIEAKFIEDMMWTVKFMLLGLYLDEDRTGGDNIRSNDKVKEVFSRRHTDIEAFSALMQAAGIEK